MIRSDSKRAVFVFFESITRLDEFYTFAFAQRPLGGQLAKITQETSELEKEDNIAAAVSSGRVPSLTRAFGRGRHSCAPNISLFEQIRGASQRQTLELLVKGMDLFIQFGALGSRLGKNRNHS
jgi:hypothetical protein